MSSPPGRRSIIKSGWCDSPPSVPLDSVGLFYGYGAVVNMSVRGRWLEEWVDRFKFLPIAILFISGFHFLAGFPPGISSAFGLAFTVIAYWIYLLFDAVEFSPYQLIIGINYAALCEDFHLVPKEGSQFENVTFTAISYVLFTRSDEGGYSRTLDIYKQLPCGAPAWMDGNLELEDRPIFFFRSVVGGYEFGIHVQQEWWASEASRWALKKLRLGNDNSVVLGFLPAGYIPDHISRRYRPARPTYNFEGRQSRWQKRLTSEGWSVDEDRPYNIRHRYLEIGFYPL
jgi:hypothetical protein